jgi:hypothetical protein
MSGWHFAPSYDCAAMRERCDGLMAALARDIGANAPKSGPDAPPKRQRKRSISHALKEAAKAGASVARVEISDDGKIALVIGEPEANKQQGNEVDEWIAKHARETERH